MRRKTGFRSDRNSAPEAESYWEGLPSAGHIDDQIRDRLLRTERSIEKVRWFAVVFGLVQIYTFYAPYPEGVLSAAVFLIMLFAGGNALLTYSFSRELDHKAIKRKSIFSLAFDTLTALGFVAIYTFDPETSIWVILFLIPLEGAARFGLTGALSVMGFLATGYVIRELYGQAVYGNEVFITSITFRMGVGFFIAAVAGIIASDLEKDRRNLHSANEKYRALLDTLGTIGEGFVVIEPPRVLYVNDAAAQMGGYSAEELTAVEDFMMFVGDEDRTKVTQTLRRALETGSPGHAEVRTITKSGASLFLEVSVQRLGPVGTTRMIAVLRDVTSRRIAELEVQRTQSMLEQAQRIARLGSWEWDGARQQFRWSTQLLEIYGLDASHRPADAGFLIDAVPIPEKEQFQSLFDKALSEGEGFTLDHSIIKPDGQRKNIHTLVWVVEDEGSKAVRLLGTSQDVTELYETQRELEIAIEREREASRALREQDAAKSDFLSTVAHELRSPLTSLRGFAGTLMSRRGTLDDETRDDFVQRIDSSATRLTQIVEELLDFSRLEHRRIELDFEEIQLDDLAAQAVADLAGLLSQHKLEIEIPHMRVEADLRAIRRVLENVISNAAKFSPAGSCITVGARPLDHQVEIRVEDEGIGIPPDQLDRVFERFHRVNRGNTSPSGTGIGLALAKQLVEAHSGTIKLENRQPKGARLTFTIPLRPRARSEKVVPPMDRDEQAPKGRG